MQPRINIFLIRFKNNCYRLHYNTAEAPVINVSKKQNFHIITNNAYNDAIRCELLYCGCRLNSFIWINHSRKLIYFENPKSGSSSIKKSLNIRPPGLVNVLIQLYLEWSKTNKFDVLIKDCNFKLTKEYIDDCINRVNDLIKYQTKSFNNKAFITHYGDSSLFELFYGTSDDVFGLFPDYYSFSFKRDPIDRFLSNYRMFKQQNNRILQLETMTKSKHDDLNLGSFIQITQKFSNHHWLPQIKYIPISSGKIRLDFLKDIKTFDSDWNYLTKKFGLNTTLERINYTDKHEAEIMRIDKEKLCAIRNMYSEDYNVLGIQ
jgi:hypothetical protein